MDIERLNPQLRRKIIQLLKKRFSEEGGEEHYERAHDRAEALLAVGLLNEAKASFERLVEVDPEDAAALDALDEINELLH